MQPIPENGALFEAETAPASEKTEKCHPGFSRASARDNGGMPPSDETDQAAAPPDPAEHLSVKQRQAIEFMAFGRGISETARLLGLNPSTIHRWKQDAHFEAALNLRISDGIDQVQAGLRSAAPEAVNTMKELMRSGRDHIRLQAAKEVLDRATSQRVGSTDAEAIERQRKAARRLEPFGL